MENRLPKMSRAEWQALIEANFAGWSSMDPEQVRYMYDQSSVSYFFDMGHVHRTFDEYARGAAERIQSFSSFEVALEELLSVVQSQAGDICTTVDVCTVTVQRKDPQPGERPKPFKVLHTVVWHRHPDGRWLIVHEHQSKVWTSEGCEKKA